MKKFQSTNCYSNTRAKSLIQDKQYKMNTSWWEPGALNEERVTDCIVKRKCGLEEHRLVEGNQAKG